MLKKLMRFLSAQKTEISKTCGLWYDISTDMCEFLIVSWAFCMVTVTARRYFFVFPFSSYVLINEWILFINFLSFILEKCVSMFRSYGFKYQRCDALGGT